ncbi:hypothetical protein TVAG_130130 [Trichomonas vaginalis G3]|uniref:DUF3447 domain-containing protein n=1 Tax=Trichomonas vaginalis (strain ATCC PRA-98 / G3) TaxID=412133 RepID=A2DIA9_TRIV3|nr:spectrin binding [Trichomonas vaginalis G3]EAY19905.1 hypothetical protein TVAG_130130 [Trichomonas vaginalis G3]KAI5509961.1 spectrin binding [Trichomonas vaginalis G3]|eukprot:XP_001580891.1 hypothetical protein [Trichomonas vaginalis G3]
MSCDCCCDCSCEADLDILPSNLKFKSIKDIQMPEEFNTYEEIEKLILNYNLENLESTFLSLKQILDADIALDQVVFNTLGYFKNFYKPDHFKNLETLLSTEYDINYKTYSIKLESVSNPNHTTNDKMNSDNISYVKKMCRSNKTETKHNLMCIACREGHINCVNYLLTTNLHLDREIARNAAFGGNMEIIQTLESKNLSFDYCLECAIARHHYALCDYLIKNYRCEKIDAKRCLEFYNFRAFYFCLENNLTKEMFIEDIAQRHYFYFFKYMAKQGFTGQVPRETILKHMIDKKYIEYVRFVFENFKIVETKDQKVIMKRLLKQRMKIF